MKRPVNRNSSLWKERRESVACVSVKGDRWKVTLITIQKRLSCMCLYEDICKQKRFCDKERRESVACVSVKGDRWKVSYENWRLKHKRDWVACVSVKRPTEKNVRKREETVLHVSRWKETYDKRYSQHSWDRVAFVSVWRDLCTEEPQMPQFWKLERFLQWRET